ncbi:MAG: hypothetical protein HY080_04935 [Gammaproteobacteria bacterium]|nr:hypothetical protein [Gammaproteobacteria bacterium]
MAATVDELTVNYFEEGKQVVKELDKEILTKGTWSTIMYKYQDFDKAKDDFGAVKYSIRRYQKRSGEYKMQSKFNISSDDQAEKIIAILQKWIQQGGGEKESE